MPSNHGRVVQLDLALLRDHRLELFRLLLDERAVPLGIGEVIRLPLPLEIEEVSVRTEEQPWLQRAQKRELAPIVFDDVRIFRVADQLVLRRYGRAAEEHRVAHRPRRTAARVAGSDVRGERHAAERHLLAVGDRAVREDRRKEELVAELRIIFPTRSVIGRLRSAGDELRFRHALQLGESAGVIVVRMAADQDLHVLDAKPEALDVCANDRSGLDETAVEQDVTFRRGDQVRRDVARADVIEVSFDAERRDRLIPRARNRIALGVSEQSREEEQQYGPDFHTQRPSMLRFPPTA